MATTLPPLSERLARLHEELCRYADAVTRDDDDPASLLELLPLRRAIWASLRRIGVPRLGSGAELDLLDHDHWRYVCGLAAGVDLAADLLAQGVPYEWAINYPRSSSEIEGEELTTWRA